MIGLRGPVEKYPNLPSILVMDLEVDITPEAINSLFGTETIKKGSVFAEKVASKGNHLQWIANTIVVDQPAWATIGDETSRHDMKSEAKLWLKFVCALIMPSKND